MAFSVIGYVELKERSFPHLISPIGGIDEFGLKRFRSAQRFAMVKKRFYNLLQ